MRVDPLVQADADEAMAVLAGKVLCPSCSAEITWAYRKVPVSPEPGVIKDAILKSVPCGCIVTLPELVRIRKVIWQQERAGLRKASQRGSV